MSIVILGIDTGKNSCSVVGLDEHGTIVVRRRMRRDGVIAFAAKLAPCTMAMEACCGVHHIGRSLVARGHEFRLMSPEYVRPYVKAEKNDDRDAETIAEAAPPARRNAGLRLRHVELAHDVPARGYARSWQEFDRRIAAFDAEFSAMAGPISGLTADRHSWHWRTERYRAGGRGRQRRRRSTRDATSPPGWVSCPARLQPGRPKLLGITKRGSRYLRKMLIQGARSAMPSLVRSDTATEVGLRALLARAHPNVAVVALAAKMARTAVWALLHHERTYQAVSITA